MRSAILGTGMFVPPSVVPNDRMARVMDTSDAWIRQRTGIVTRRLAEPGVGTSDLAVPAARAALEDAGMAPHEIDYVVVATMTPDYYFPGVGSLLQLKLGLPAVPCLDIRQQCAGFVYGLQVADGLVRSGTARRVLLVGAEVHGGFMPWNWDVVLGRSDEAISPEEYAFITRYRDRLILFGDGAGAVVMGPAEDGRGLVDVRIHTDGSQWSRMRVNGGGSAYRPYFDAEMIARGDLVPVVEGRDVYRAAVQLMPEALLEVLERNGLTLDDLDLLLMHQANLRINEAVQKRLGLPDAKVFNNIQKYGNTTAATIPMALHEARTAGLVRPGSLVAFVALGSGLHWGAALHRF